MSRTPVVIDRRRELKSVVAIRLEQVGGGLKIRDPEVSQRRVVRARLEGLRQRVVGQRLVRFAETEHHELVVAQDRHVVVMAEERNARVVGSLVQ